MAAARRFVGSCLVGWGHDLQMDVAVLLTSEVVTNAVLHGGPHTAGAEVVVEVDVSPVRVRVVVSDEGLGRPTLGRPVANDLSGRGLRLVDSMSSSWGMTPNATGKSVWFEVDALVTPLAV